MSRPFARWLLPWLPSLAYMALIWALSSQSRPMELPDVPMKDKVAHCLEYGVLAVLNLRALRQTFVWPRLRSVAIAVLLTSAWGFFDELHQAFVPGRFSDVYDWIADTVGAITFASVAAIALRARIAARGEPTQS